MVLFICLEYLVVGDLVVNRYKMFFWSVFFMFLSFSSVFIFVYYIIDYLNLNDVVKVYPPIFFVFSSPLLMYFSFITFIISINKSWVLSNNDVLKKIFKYLLCVVALSFIFVIAGPAYIDDDLISKGYIKCQKSSMKLQVIYVVDADLCKK